MYLLHGFMVSQSAPKAARVLQFHFLYMLMSSAVLAASKAGRGAQLWAACNPQNTGNGISERTRRSPAMETSPSSLSFRELCPTSAVARVMPLCKHGSWWVGGIQCPFPSADWRGFTNPWPWEPLPQPRRTEGSRLKLGPES